MGKVEGGMETIAIFQNRVPMLPGWRRGGRVARFSE